MQQRFRGRRPCGGRRYEGRFRQPPAQPGCAEGRRGRLCRHGRDALRHRAGQLSCGYLSGRGQNRYQCSPVHG